MKRLLVWSVVILTIGSVLILGADHALKSKDHPGVRTFLHQWLTNYPASFRIEPDVLSITVSEQEMEQLNDVVEKARDRGVILPEGNQYVDATFNMGGREFTGRLRIKGKLTDHVQGEKWSFRVIARKDGGMYGMQRFSLQHPGTRNYLCDWFYHRLSAGEGIIALRYGFIRVLVNGEDLGIYAFEEHFGDELLENNGRLAGPLLRFDPALFWVHRLARMKGKRLDEPYAEYQAAAVDAYGTNDMLKDPERKRWFEEAVAVLDAFRSGTLSASQSFDADLIARRHALIDLIGGHHSMDWSDVKFYFDPVAKKLEPVSYESFSAFPTRRLAGAGHFRPGYWPAQELHDRFFSDPVVFRAYVGHLERMARKEYMDSTFAAIAPQLDSASATLYREFPYKELDRGIYYRNQKAILDLLAVPKPFHAFLQGVYNDTAVVAIQAIESLPMEALALDLVDDTHIELMKAVIVPPRGQGDVAKVIEVRFPLAGMDSTTLADATIRCRVLGSSRVREVPLFGYAFLGGEHMLQDVMHASGTVDQFPFLVSTETGFIDLLPGKWTVEKDLIIPDGQVLRARSPLDLTFSAGASLIGHSGVELIGETEQPISIRLGAGSTIRIVGASAKSVMTNVFIDGMEGGPDVLVTFHKTSVEFRQCRFAADRPSCLLALSMVTGSLNDLVFQRGTEQLHMEATAITATSILFDGASDDALMQRGGKFVGTDIRIANVGGTGLDLGSGARSEINDLRITTAARGVDAGDGARVTISGCTLRNMPIGVKAGKEKMRYGPVEVELKGLRTEDVERPFDQRPGSTILNEGKRVGVSESEQGT